MYKQNRLLERELKFTEVYRQNQNEIKAIRELRVLEQQIPNYFITPRDNDLIAGRIDRPFVTLSVCLEGDGLDKVGYAIDEKSCYEALKTIENDTSYDAEYAEKVRDMINFWHNENTNTKIRARIPKEFLFAIPSDDYINCRAAVHPIYRIAGLNLDYGKLYKYGINGLKKLLGNKENELYSCMSGVLDLIKNVIYQYELDTREKLEKCKDEKRKTELKKMLESLINIQTNPPQNFREALQLQVIYMLAGRSVEIGRLDNYMSEIYQKSIKEGTITRDEAVLLLDNFFTIIEEERGRDTRAIIGGTGRNNEAIADEFSFVVLDVLERRKFRFYPQVSLRCYKGMNEGLLNRSLELLKEGYPYPLLYNDDVNVPSVMRAMDVSRDIAHQYSFFGCGEFMLDKKSCGTPNTALSIAKVLELTLFNGIDPKTGEQTGLKTGEFTNDTTYEEFVSRFKKQIDFFCDICGTIEELVYDVCNEEFALLQASILMEGCIEKGKALLDGGIFHLGGTVETYGNVTAYDGLSAIKHTIYDKKLITQEHLTDALKADFEGFGREYLLLKNAPKFGNDDEYADNIAVEMHEYICNAIRRQKDRTHLDSFLAVIINNSMNVTLGKHCGATPDGRKDGDYMSNGNSPVNGADKNGLTALINSMTKMDTSIHACANQNFKLSTRMFENNYRDIISVIETFFAKGGQQMNLSVINQADLEDAMIHPEKHENLIVRVGGFSARFVTLDPDIQRDILQRNAY